MKAEEEIERCHGKPKGLDWVFLVAEQPQFADKCPWNLLPYECYKEFCGWEYLLERQPQFAEKCNWERMPGHSVLTLLREHPSLAKYVVWAKLTGINWCCLLKESPQYGQYCDWKKLDGVWLWMIFSSQPASSPPSWLLNR